VSGALPIVALTSSITFGVSLAWVVMHPPRRLAPRVRPYTLATRADLHRSPDVLVRHHRGRSSVRAPCVDSSLRSLGRLLIG